MVANHDVLEGGYNHQISGRNAKSLLDEMTWCMERCLRTY